MDAPTTTEWSAFWSIPLPARLYNASLVVVATVITTASSFSRLSPDDLRTLLGLLVCGMVNVELGRLAEGGRVERQRIHKGLSAWPLAAALLLGPGLAGWVAGAVYLHAGVRGIRIRRWKWAGSWAIVTLAATAASAAHEAASGGQLEAAGSAGAFGGVVAAIAAFLVVETLLLVAISRLNSAEDEVYLRAQLASAGFYLVELSVLCTGALAAVLFRYWAGFILLGGPASLLIQRGMLHEPLQEQARHDAKTGLLNSEAWRSAAACALSQAGRDGRYSALVVVDVDHFKQVNDTFGHVVGDDVLARTAGAIVDAVRKTDVVGRFGGDEFCALLTCDSAGEALGAGERIRTLIRDLTFEATGLAVTASIGVAVTRCPAATDVNALLLVADAALYASKTAGRDHVSALEAA